MNLSETPQPRRRLIEGGIRRLEEAGIPDARRNVEWMLGDVLQTSRAMLYAYPEREVPAAAVRSFEAMLERRRGREPLQYILGYTDFYGLRLHVTPDVLIPRPETEQVVEEALRLLTPCVAPRVLDVGTGSGCIPIALKHERPDAEVAACDVSSAALRIAGANAARHRLPIAFLQADVLAPDFSAGMPGRLDLLISNPPYVAAGDAAALEPEVRDFEPHLALFSGDDPLRFYRALVRHAPALLVPGGFAVFETHPEYGGAVRELMRAAGFQDVALKDDLAGLPRIATGRWI